MMKSARATNRAMFWRIIRRLFGANRGRLFVILLALGAGAAVTAALLNLQVDAKRRLTAEFRSLGANVMITSRSSEQALEFATIPESVLDHLPAQEGNGQVSRAAFLYAMADVTAYSDEGTNAIRLGSAPAVIAGYRYVGEDFARIIPYRVLDGSKVVILDTDTCEIGERIATQFSLHAAGALELKVGRTADSCIVSQVRSFGGTEDNQVFVSMEQAQQLTGLPRQVSLILLSVPGSPTQIDRYVETLHLQFADLDVRPIRQFTEGEAKIYNRISGLLTATVATVLLLTGLCVMAAMTNVAMERKMDVGLMKAIGGSMRRVLRLFLAEAALLGLAGGIIGAAAGIFLSIGLGKAVFGVAARPRLIVYPVAVALTVIVAILSAFPLRRLASIRPASVFRGEA
jgi:putative ABC transport system permease protein